MAMSKTVLIAGAGVAGPSCALLLTRHGHKVTIVERSPEIRKTGQQVDVAGQGVKVVKEMGIWATLLKRSTGEEGIKFVDGNDRVAAAFPVSKESGASSFVKEIEILRGDMADVLYEQTKESTEYIMGDQITALSEQDTHVTASFANSPDRVFHLVIVADGLFSKTRDIAFGTSAGQIRSLGQCTALMSIPWEPSDGNWSRWFNALGGRAIVTRPQAKKGQTGAYLAIMTPESGRIARLPVREQKEEFRELFQDAGWEAPRVIREMMKSDDFYVQETAQAKMDSWVKGRVVLLGDAGYCPSPVSGQGTTLAFIGAYILAGCINTHEDYRDALSKYEEQMRPFVEKSQQLFPGVPGIANPQTAWGIKILYTCLWLGSLMNNSGIVGLVGRVLGPLAAVFSSDLELPKY